MQCLDKTVEKAQWIKHIFPNLITLVPFEIRITNKDCLISLQMSFTSLSFVKKLHVEVTKPTLFASKVQILQITGTLGI